MSSIYSIYKATNTINGKVYIGFDSKWPRRQMVHKSNHKKILYKFYNAILKYGWENFEWEILYQSKDREHTLRTMEPQFIKEYDSFKTGYNSTLGGEGVFGRIVSNEERKIKSKNMKGKNCYWFGKKQSEESNKKRSLSLKGKKKSKRTESHSLNSSLSQSLEWIVTSPDGKIYEIQNLKKFCLENNINPGNMYSVSSGKQKSCKGWLCSKKTILPNHQ
jgi:group I intron endonuclease